MNIENISDLMSAIAQRRTVQMNLLSNTVPHWVDIKTPEVHSFDFNVFEYRVKPTDGYRPFKNASECWDEMLKHYPFGWLRDKEDENMLYPVDTFDMSERAETVLYFSCGWHTLHNLFDKYIFADGTPFGIKETM